MIQNFLAGRASKRAIFKRQHHSFYFGLKFFSAFHAECVVFFPPLRTVEWFSMKCWRQESCECLLCFEEDTQLFTFDGSPHLVPFMNYPSNSVLIKSVKCFDYSRWIIWMLSNEWNVSLSIFRCNAVSMAIWMAKHMQFKFHVKNVSNVTSIEIEQQSYTLILTQNYGAQCAYICHRFECWCFNMWMRLSVVWNSTLKWHVCRFFPLWNPFTKPSP